MSTTKPTLPLALRLFNGLLAGTDALGIHLARIDVDSMLRTASQQTGLTDFGSDYFRGPLARLCKSLQHDAHLTGMGRIVARQGLLRLLENRLHFVELFKQHPEITEQEISQPLFILGMPRTGTTSLHELMALDPQFRVPLSWEVAHPFPPPQTATYHTDPRIALVQKELDQVDKILPNFKDMHPMGAQLPQECVALFAHDFVSMIFDVQFRLTQYQAWLIQEDMTEVFKNHRRWLQLLQWKCPGDTWVLKSPQYLWNIEDMLREYPDARVIQAHRDPVKVAVSVGNLTATLRGMASNDVDLQECSQHYADLLDYGTRKTLAARDKGLLLPERVIDVQFTEFRKDPVAAVRVIYDFFGLEFNQLTAQRMQSFLDSGQEAGRHGKHHYDLAASGLDLQRERARFAHYQQLYNIPSEE
jgi:hypothetical protein